jgi:hypothetical protein
LNPENKPLMATPLRALPEIRSLLVGVP